jgi:threonine aldolase
MKTKLNIDLRSDTISFPSKEMLEFMQNLNLDNIGDDVFGEDKYVTELEELASKIFGMEAGLFCPSGTMTNQIAIHLQSGAGKEVICDAISHVYLYEGGGIAANSNASVRLLHGENGKFRAEDVLKNINKEDVHFPRTSLVCIENTVNRGGGACWDFSEIEKIKNVCDSNKINLHLDGARIFNAIVANDENPQKYGKIFNSISICLSKGLGAPVGSVLLGSKSFIFEARRVRKRWGGGMRQAGFIAGAGIYALNNNIHRLASDHQRAKEIGEILVNRNWVKTVLPIETNIVIFELFDNVSFESFLSKLGEFGIKAIHIGDNKIRFVFHINQTNEDIEYLKEILQEKVRF